MVDLQEADPILYRTGLWPVDDAIGGVAPGELCVVGARPSHGKTLFGLQWMFHIATQGTSCLIVSEEMTARALAKRAIQNATSISERVWRERWDAVFDDVVEFSDARRPILITEGCHSVTVAQDAINQAVVHHGVKFAVVDYVQLLTARGQSRYEQVSEVSRVLKQTAVENDIAIIALAQLNRAVETEKGCAPQLHHLRDSGQIEQDADVVLFLQWPYQNDNKYEDEAEYRVICAKNRNRGIMGSRVRFVQIDAGRQMLTAGGPDPNSVLEEWNLEG